MATTHKRRARAGYTHDPYECCGKEAGTYGRPKREICGECRGLIEDGQRSRTTLQQQDLAVYRWTERNYGWPRYYRVPGHFRESDVHYALADAMFALVNRLSVPAPADTPAQAPTYKMVERSWDGRRDRVYDPWPTVFPVQEHVHDSWTWNQLILLPPATREALVQLDATIRTSLEDRFEAGKDTGRNLLLALAHGESTIADFEEQQRTERERMERQR